MTNRSSLYDRGIDELAPRDPLAPEERPVGYDPAGDVARSVSDRVNKHTDATPDGDSADRIVFAFDRDHTVNVGELSAREDRELVPLEWVQYLAHMTPHYVYATGNQSLTTEADIPGISDIVDQHPRGEELAAADSPRLSAFGPSRRTRVEMLTDIHEASQYIVVDDVDLSDLDGWDHYTSWEFVPAVREETVLEDVSLPEEVVGRDD